MATFRMYGGTAPFRESVERVLTESGYESAPDDEGGYPLFGEDDVALVYCEDEDLWDLAAKLVVKTHVLCIITRLDIPLYRRALALGAGVVHHDSLSEVIGACAMSIARQEVLIPQIAAQRLAERARTDDIDFEMPGLSRFEQQLVAGYLARMSWRELADTFGYSTRTLQRRIQHIKIKVGVTTRDELVERIERL